MYAHFKDSRNSSGSPGRTHRDKTTGKKRDTQSRFGSLRVTLPAGAYCLWPLGLEPVFCETSTAHGTHYVGSVTCGGNTALTTDKVPIDIC